jgi:hypothetical protein
MKAKGIVTVVLLAFVGVSMAYLIISEAGSTPATPAEPPVHAAVPPGPGAPADAAVDPAELPGPAAHKLVAYYFHRTQRCKTCRTIEAYAKEALEESYPEAIKSGELEWRVINVEEPANEHFVSDFGLTSSALVLVNMHDGEQGEWRNLERVWELVGDELKFKAYVAAEAMPFLGDGS